MNVSKRKVVFLADDEKDLISRVIDILDDLEDELAGHYDFSDLRNDLEEIQNKKYVIEDENHDYSIQW